MRKNWLRYALFGVCCLVVLGLAANISINANEEEKKDEMESVKKPAKKATETGDNNQATVSIKRKYYGVEMNSDHIVFVIDVTGSMSRPLSGEVIEQAKKIVGTVTGESAKVVPNVKNQPRKQGENIDWDKIKNHLDLAKAELIEAIKSLDSKISFTVIKYSTTVSVVEGSFGNLMMPATEANKVKVIDKIEKIQPSGGTDAFFDALLKAVEYGKDIKDNKKGDKDGKKASVTGEEKEEPKKPEPKKELPYEIFFLTDGAPTIESGNVIMPNDKIQANLKKLAEALEKKNIMINTIGIGDHWVELMEALAKMSGGQYVNLGPKKKDKDNQNNNPQK